MGRVLAFDYGRKRVGVAVTDSLQIIANGLCTVPSATIFSFIAEYVKKESVDVFIVGYAKQMDSTESESMQYIKPFVSGLKSKFPLIPVVYVDERFTSVLAHQALLQGGAKKKTRQNKALVDEISATIILQTYMESKRNGTL